MSGVVVACPGCQVKNRIPDQKQHLTALCGKCGSKITIGNQAVPVVLGDGNFQKFIKEVALPLMVDFYAPTCGPCQAIAPLVAKLAQQYAGRVVIAKINTSQHPGTAAHYQIRGVPTLLFFKNGIVVDQILGAPSEVELTGRLDSLARSA